MKKATHKSSAPILNARTLEKDFSTLVPILKEGLRVLDVGCGAGAISKGIAEKVGKTGQVVGIDRNQELIEEGKVLFGFQNNLTLHLFLGQLELGREKNSYAFLIELKCNCIERINLQQESQFVVFYF